MYLPLFPGTASTLYGGYVWTPGVTWGWAIPSFCGRKEKSIIREKGPIAGLIFSLCFHSAFLKAKLPSQYNALCCGSVEQMCGTDYCMWQGRVNMGGGYSHEHLEEERGRIVLVLFCRLPLSSFQLSRRSVKESRTVPGSGKVIRQGQRGRREGGSCRNWSGQRLMCSSKHCGWAAAWSGYLQAPCSSVDSELGWAAAACGQ